MMNIRAILLITAFVLLLLPSPGSAAGLSCVDCHPDKNENTVVHPAVAMGCAVCHSGTHQGEKPTPTLNAAVPDLCFTCHDQSAFQNKVQHPPVAGGMCLACHTPHAGPNAKLLTAPVPDLCFTCHDQTAFQKRVQHPPAAAGMCLTCHAPHASEKERLLTAGVNDLCSGCHDKQASGRHVLQGLRMNDQHPLRDRPDPSRPGRTLSCVSCHNPHASDRDRLFQGKASAQSGICLLCHRKIAVVP